MINSVNPRKHFDFFYMHNKRTVRQRTETEQLRTSTCEHRSRSWEVTKVTAQLLGSSTSPRRLSILLLYD